MIVGGRRVPLAPPEGWLTVGLVLLLCLTLAWSVDDARLVVRSDVYTDFLPWAAVGGVLIGFIGPTVGWGRWTTYLVGALFAALVLPLIVGTVLLPDGGTPFELFRRTAGSAVRAFDDLVLIGRLTTPQYGHHLLAIGLLVWASSMFASYAVFGHRRPLNGVLLIGLMLVVNMSFTFRDQLVYLVLFSLAALFLLIRSHTLEEQTDWIRRRIGDPSAIAGMYLRGGTIFIGAAVVGSLLLTNVAQSAPLAGAWSDVGNQVIDWSRGLSRFLPQSGTGPILAPSFGASATITGQWSTSDAEALTIEIPADAIMVKPYWRAVTYDVLALDGFERSEDATPVDREAGESLLDGTGDAVGEAGRRAVTYRIIPVRGSAIFAPQTPLTVDVAAEVQLVGGDEGYFAAVDRRDGSGPYTVTALVPLTGDAVEGGLTQNRLRVAGEAYPSAIEERYAQKPGEAILGPSARVVMDDILQKGATNPYDLAQDIVTYLQDKANFQYDANVNDNGDDCSQLSKVECFAQFRRGYCQYYAGLMAAILREQGVPARVAEGFLPGERSPGDLTEVVRNSSAHSWVEVYFPGYGWVDFDPTGGGVARLEGLPVGRVQPSASPGAFPTGTALTRNDAEPSLRGEPDGNGGAGTIDRGTPVGPLIAVALLLAVAVGVLAAVAWRRGPRGPVTADGAYGSVTRLASRFGFGPRPNQTVYEYAGALADILPDARPELETVARAKVEVVYGGRALGEDRLAALREAHRRLRTSLLRLVLRRDRRRRR